MMMVRRCYTQFRSLLRRTGRRLWVFSLWMLCGLSLLMLLHSGPQVVRAQHAASPALQLEQQGRRWFEAEQFSDAIALWEQAAQAYGAEGASLQQAQMLSYLSAAHQQLAQWDAAQAAIDQSLQLLQTVPASTAKPQILAQALNTQGSLSLAMGRAETALTHWQQATQAYRQAQDPAGMVRSQINQAQAYRALGFYRRALSVLEQVRDHQAQQPDSLLKAASLRSLGVTFQQLGSLEASAQALNQSVAIAQALNASTDVAAAQFELANTLRLQQQPEAALATYRQAATTATTPLLKAQALLNQFSLQLDRQQWQAAQSLWPQVQAQLAALPASAAQVQAQLNVVQHLTEIQPHHPIQGMTWPQIAQLAATSLKQAQTLGNPRTESYALGILGHVYEQTQQWPIAQDLTEQALVLAQAHHAPDIAYQWQWQLGRLLKRQVQPGPGADYGPVIAVYTEAVDTLQSIRNELASYNSEIRFSFEDNVEPVYRELVSLLLQPPAHGDLSQAQLEQAREVMEALHLVELDNFFREACLDTQSVAIDQIDNQAAVIYPISLPDRLDVIVRLPDQPLRHFTTPVAPAELEATANQLRQTLVIRSKRAFRPFSRQLYDWLIRPIASDLVQSGVNTLVFVLDGSLRNVPMATLNDGQQYLIEQYRIALTPGLQLLAPQPLQQRRLQVLASGLTQARQGFAPLNHVAAELESIQASLPSQVLIDQDFTPESLQQETTATAYPIVHIATHGQFSSTQAETFLLAWDKRIDVNQLRTILQQRTTAQPDAVELLVLSACNTAVGDQRATLGLAGLAIRSGARSTVATLWPVDDRTTSKLMGQLYQALAQQQTTKAEALRQAQLSLLQDRFSRHPYYWAPYILVGNWL